ncbi:hypothetical protein FS320_41125 [Microvirga tunisiensis]|uniref:Winged helix-turn helix domain-containing protein n=1 Tax=Microvirga tunisiensis TaxID=2108360 RepID=A0A5N7MW07_9HYPH|nr:hypothetical protein [Microvirga tunisiensis]MPR31141.1 hypothetical protein [Microvirga tunisiensis]
MAADASDVGADGGAASDRRDAVAARAALSSRHCPACGGQSRQCLPLGCDPGPRGPRGLEARAIPGPSPRLDEKAWTRLGRLLDRGAVAAGFATERWTLERIAALIAREFGVRYHPRYLERPLKAHGFSVQRPATRAKERDELVIAVWPKRDWVALKKIYGPAVRCKRAVSDE